jgi:TolB-like protein/Flp pilus assembly protein TadD
VSLFSELKRRGVFQVGAAYIVVSWLIVQVASVLLPTFEAPAWVMKATVLLLVLGFPLAVAISWIFDLTAAGLVRTDELTEDIRRTAVHKGHLNHIIIGLLAAAVLLFTLDKFYWQTDLGSAENGEMPSLAVLPFDNMSGDLANEPFAVGIHDDLLTQISKIGTLRTVSRTSVLRYRGTSKPLRDVARELGVANILEGGVQRSADRVRINAQLIDAESDTHLWAETFDRRLTAANIFAIQSDIARAIARALRARLTRGEEAQLDRVPTESLDAYDAYLKARALLDDYASLEELTRAATRFELATELDPAFAAAWAGLCRARLGLYRKSSDRTWFDQGESACRQALELDDTRVEVHIALGMLYRYFGQYSRAEVALERANLAKAEQALEEALDLDRLTVDGLIELGLVHAQQNRLAEAETELQRAVSLDPGNWSAQSSLFSFYYRYSDRPDHFELAARHAAKAASLRPDLAASWTNLGTANFMLARYEEAADAWRQSLEIEPTRTAYSNTGLAYYNDGRFEEAVKMQLKALEIAPDDHRAMGRLADAQRFADGNGDRAVETYGRAAELARAMLAVNEQDWRTLGLLAHYLAQAGQVPEATEAARKALQLSRRNAETLYYASLVQLAGGDTEACLELLEEAVSKDGYYRHLIGIDPDMQRLSELERFRAIVGSGT